MERFPNGGLTMAVRRFGTGPAHFLAFHGFGRTSADFSAMAPSLAASCTLHAFDLPCHGESPGLQPGQPIKPEQLADFFHAYLRSRSIPQAGLMGYSLGGRIALCLLERSPAMFTRAFLLAPDGLVPRPWYRSLAHYRIGRWLYRAFIDHPGTTHAAMRLLHRLGMLDGRMFRFLMDRTATPQARALLHEVWTGFRLIEPRLATVAANIQAHHIPVHLLLGQFDRVIRPSSGRRLLQLAPNEVRVHLLPTGHRMLNGETGSLIASLLQAGA